MCSDHQPLFTSMQGTRSIPLLGLEPSAQLMPSQAQTTPTHLVHNIGEVPQLAPPNRRLRLKQFWNEHFFYDLGITKHLTQLMAKLSLQRI